MDSESAIKNLEKMKEKALREIKKIPSEEDGEKDRRSNSIKKEKKHKKKKDRSRSRKRSSRRYKNSSTESR